MTITHTQLERLEALPDKLHASDVSDDDIELIRQAAVLARAVLEALEVVAHSDYQFDGITKGQRVRILPSQPGDAEGAV